jgi:hypothetical protein
MSKSIHPRIIQVICDVEENFPRQAYISIALASAMLSTI